jgi:ABC-type lipoprotein export system ATPase subunit
MTSAPPPTAVLEMRGVTRRFTRGPEKVEALRGVALTVGRGEIVAVVGASGSGKTTLLNLAGGVDRPDSGQILIADRRLDAVPEAGRTRLRREAIGMVFQECHLVEELTVAQNVALPLLFAGKPAEPGLVDRLLAEVEISERRGFHPPQLSGGERQRAAIARALVCAPALLLADEPTGSLDSAQAARIFDLFRALAQHRGLAILIATHNLELARRADRVLRLQDGVLTTY